MTLTPFVDGIWIDSEPVRIVGMPLTSTMTAIRLDDGGMLLYSPVAMTAERRAAIEALGPVTQLYAPNLFHHRWLGEWARAFPSARLHAPAGLSKKRPDLRVARTHCGDVDAAFVGAIEERHIDGFRLEECVLVHRVARTLIVADLIHNVGRPHDAWSKFYTRTMGFYDRVAISRMLRWTAFSDRVAARKSIDQLLAMPFEGVIFGHGAPLARGGKKALEEAFSWLSP